jgi:Fe-S cluster assembly ATP-binding protein
MIKIRSLSVNVEGKKVLKNVNMEIPEKEIHLLLGPNGSGKTSLMKTIMGYPEYNVTGGEIIMKGKSLEQSDLTDRARIGIGLAEQHPPSISGVKLEMLLDYILKKDPERRNYMIELIKSINLDSLLNRNINDGLSGGEIKKSELLLLIARQPCFAMLDEPDSGVDIDSLELLSILINRLFSPNSEIPAKRNTGLIITHSKYILDKVRVDKAHVILSGEIVCSGNPYIIMEKIIKSGFDSCAECRGEMYEKK